MNQGGWKRSNEGKNFRIQECRGLRSGAGLCKRRQGEGAWVLNTETARDLHASIVDEVLKHKAEGDLFRTRDKGTPCYMVSQHEPVVIESKEGSGSRG